MTCCGKERKTAYCPDCGKKLMTEPILSGLLASCRKTEATVRKVAADKRGEAEKRGAQGNAELVKLWTQRAARAEAQADKWKAWGDALEALLHPEGGEGE